MTHCPKCCGDCGHRRSAHGPAGCRKCLNNRQRSKPCQKFQERQEDARG